MRIAFLAHPLPYGLYTVYKNLRDGIAPQGIELRWTAFAHHAVDAVASPEWAGEMAYGEVVEADPNDGARQAAAMVRHLESSGYAGICLSPPYERVQMNLPRYLDRRMLRILTVQSMALGVSRLTSPLRDYVHAAVGASPRVQEDLIGRAGYRPAIVSAIPNGIAPEPFAGVMDRRAQRRSAGGTGSALKLLYLGRIEENQKGVFWLAPLMQRLHDVDCTLTVAGDGPDLPELKRRLAPIGARVMFAGVVAPSAVPALLADHDVLLLLSRSEGMPNVLIEAMAAGCVPVSSRIRGLTDFMITHGSNGMLFPVGDMPAAAAAVREIVAVPERLSQLSTGARADFLARFTAAEMGRAYAAVIHRVAAAPPPIADPLPMSQWAMPSAFKPSLAHRLIPRKLKNRIQQWLG